METIGTQTEQCPLENIETQTQGPCVFSMETQMDFPTTNVVVQTNSKENAQVDGCIPQGTFKVVVQTDFKRNAPADYCMSQEAAEAAIQTDSMVTQDDETQTEETYHYVPLLREAVIMKLRNELKKTL